MFKKDVRLDEEKLVKQYSAIDPETVKTVGNISKSVMEELMEDILTKWELPKEKIASIIDEQMKMYEEKAEKGEDTPFTKMIRDRQISKGLSEQVKNEMEKGLGFARLTKLKLQKELAKRDGLEFDMYQVAKKNYKGAPLFLNAIKSFNNGTYAQDGGYLIMEQYSNEIIDLLREEVFLFKSGAEVIPMPKGNLNIPIHEAGALSYWQGEGRKAIGTKQGFGTIKLNSKKLVSMAIMTDELIMNNSYNADKKFLQDILREMEVMINKTALYGKGTEYEPTGIYNTKGVTIVDWNGAVDGDMPANIVGEVYKTNVPARKTAFVFNGALWAPLYNVKDVNGNYIHRDEMKNKTLTGSPYYRFNGIPVGTDVNGTTDVFFGDWEQFIIGEQAMFDVAISTEATIDGVNLFEIGATAIKVTSMLDFAIKHPEAFVVYKNVYTK